jgi:hypothetical protein
LSMQTRIH